MHTIFLDAQKNYGVDFIIGNKKFVDGDVDQCVKESQDIANMLSELRNNTPVHFVLQREDGNVLYSSMDAKACS